MICNKLNISNLNQGFDYFGARYYSSDLSIWLSVDPLSDERPGLSPYNYCQLNPVMRIDPTGMLDDDYSVSKSGEVKLEKTTDDKHDMLYTKADYDAGKTDNGLKVEDQTILPELAKDRQAVTREDAEGTVTDNGTLRHASSSNKKDMANVFTFLAKNTDVEWSMYSTKDGNFGLGTYQFDDLSPGPSSYGLGQNNVKVGIHSHPNPNSLASEEESLFGDRSVVKKVPYSYYIFMGKSSNLYNLSSDGKKASRAKNVSPSVILKIMK